MVIVGNVALSPTIFGITNALEKFQGKALLEDYGLSAEKNWDTLLFGIESNDGKKFHCKVAYELKGTPPVPENAAASSQDAPDILKNPSCYYVIETDDAPDEKLQEFIKFICVYLAKMCRGLIYHCGRNAYDTLEEYQKSGAESACQKDVR